MRRLSILTLTIMGLVVGGAAPLSEPINKAGLIVLFGARWCAPCMVEYRNLPALAAAVAPDRLALAWTDQTIAARAAPNVISLPANDARRLALDIAGPGYGLPFSVKFDQKGDVCAIWRAPLEPKDIAVLRVRCAQSGAPERGK